MKTEVSPAVAAGSLYEEHADKNGGDKAPLNQLGSRAGGRFLLARVEANNREVEFINRRLPMGPGELFVAELIARGLRGFVESSVDVPSITRSVRLPSFEWSRHEPFAWPRSL
jgi:hypothetical protein